MELKLRDIIWELTLKCGKGCKYCGSQNVLRKENSSLGHMLHIAQEIGSYGVDIVTLSGGEPGEVPENDLIQVIDSLKSYGCDVRAITNGRLLRMPKVVNRLNIVGLSINSPNEHLEFTIPHKDIVMVTNFGTHNIWEFDKLAEIARSFKSWQIQLTTGAEFMLNSEGISYLRKKIRELDGVKYILADNLQDEHKCSAGIVSCGITVDGDVIPCLSERTSGSVSVQGNLFKRSLKDIWETEFRDIRFGSGWNKSCRTCIKYPEVKELTPTIAPREKINAAEKFSKIVDDVMKPQKRPRDSYGGCSGGNVMSYGVTDWNITPLSCYEEVVWR